MDDIDRKLLVLYSANPRIHLRELARNLGISRQAINHRLQVLTGLGVIKNPIAGISISYLNAVPVAISGVSRRPSMDDAMDRLGESDLTRRVVVCAGNYLYVVGFLRNIHELNEYVEFVRRAADMSEPLVGVYCLDDGLTPKYSIDGSGARPRRHRELSPLDLKIVASLRDSARRPVAEIAKTVGASAKTVRRHIERMVSDGSIDITAPADMASGGDILMVMHISLRNGADKLEFGKRLLAKHSFQDEYIRTHSNIPATLFWVFWTNRMTEARRVLGEINEEEQVKSAMINVVYDERIYPTWRDRLVESQANERGRGIQQDSRRRAVRRPKAA